MKELLNNLNEIIDGKEEDTLMLSIIEAILLFVSGIAITYGINNSKTGFVIGGVCTLIGFIILKYKSLSKTTSTAKEIVNHLITKDDYDIVKYKYQRRIKLDEYIDNSIQSLNNSTCPIISKRKADVCDQNLQEGINNVLKDFIEKPGFFLNTHEPNYSIGLLINGVFERPQDYVQGQKIQLNDEILKLRDDLNIWHLIPKNMGDTSRYSGTTLSIFTQILSTNRNNNFVTNCIDINDIGHTLVTSPVLSVCDGRQAAGVLFILFPDQCDIPEDVEETIQILGRITSNWISKYNLCVIEHFEYLKAQSLSNEVDTWKQWLESEEIDCCSVCPPKEVLFEEMKSGGHISEKAVEIIEKSREKKIEDDA